MFNNDGQLADMNMADYLERIGTGLILSNHDVFNFDFVPPNLVGRNEAQRKIASLFSGIENHSKSCRAVITGPVGSGKTALVKTFCRDITRHLHDIREIRTIHVNCRTANTASSIVQRIVQSLDPGHPDRGLGMGEMFTSIRRLIRRQQAHLILTLDEVDHLLRRSGDDLLYKLLRIDEDQNETGTLSLILISQEQILDFLETAVISRIGGSHHMRLQGYGYEGLFEIVKQRAELGLKNGSFSHSTLQLIAEAAEPFGDARQVIEILEGAAKCAEGEGRTHLNDADVQRTASNIPSQSHEPQLESLPLHACLMLIGICRRLKKEESVTSGEIEKLYHVVCEEFEEKPKGYTTLWKYTKKASDSGIIFTRTDHIGEGRGRTQHITIPHMLPKDLEEKILRIINKLKRK